jgi:putative transposase
VNKEVVMSAYVRWLVAQKQKWHHPLSGEEAQMGFKGWHTRGYLPHFDAPGVVQMLNFRLADSLPQDRREEWSELLKLADDRERRIRLESYLDLGHGACELALPQVAQHFEQTCLKDDGNRCGLLAWVVMPNHVHLLVEVWTTPVPELIECWKSLSTRFVNRQLGRSGPWWQADYFDRYIRDETHFQKAVHYIENNPLKAGLVRNAKEWRWSSARWRPEGFGLQPLNRPDPE